MIRTILPSAALAVTFVFSLPANATLLTRTFVSSAGSNSNPCTITQPCASFQTAYNLTAPSGIIAALDPGKYGPLLIFGPITINGNGWSAITGPASGSAISINVDIGTKVVLIGLELDGAGISSSGIEMNSAGTLIVTDSLIRNFTLAGIDYNTTTPASQIFVSNTTISENGTGIRFLFNSGGSATTNCVLDHVRIVNSSVDGLNVTTTTTPQQNINVTVTDSVIANNESDGINVLAANGAKANVMVRNTTIANNGSFGLIAQGSAASIRITRSTVTANGHGWTNNTGGQVTSYFDNNIEDNGTDNGAPVQIPEK